MLLIPNELFIEYIAYINKRGITAAYQGQYKKWLRYRATSIEAWFIAIH
jgi:hypothetical protein